jgi:putative chitinase
MAYKVYTVPTASKAQYRKNIFRYAYGGVLGNEDPDNNANTEDGWKYRGKGAIQLTGKDNYERNQNEIQEWFNLNHNLVTNPDLVATNQTVLVYSAIAYILQNVNTIADIDVMTIDQFSALVNTGNSNSSISNVNGATDRRNRYNNLIQNDNLFKCDAQ